MSVFVLLLSVPVNNFGQAGCSVHLTTPFSLASSSAHQYLTSTSCTYFCLEPGRDRTRDPGTTVRHASMARRVTDCIMRLGSSADKKHKLNANQFKNKIKLEKDKSTMCIICSNV